MNIYQKLMNVKSEIGVIYKSANNPFSKSTYAPLSDILKAINPLLEKEGLFISWEMFADAGDDMRRSKIWHITCTIHDVNDLKEFITYNFHVPQDDKGTNEIQKWGATATYAKRYIYAIIFDIAFDNDDPDARVKRLDPSKKIIKQQLPADEDIKKIEKAINELPRQKEKSIGVDLSTGEIKEEPKLVRKDKTKYLPVEAVSAVWQTAKENGFSSELWAFVLKVNGWTKSTVPAAKKDEFARQFTQEGFQHWYKQWEGVSE